MPKVTARSSTIALILLASVAVVGLTLNNPAVDPLHLVTRAVAEPVSSNEQTVPSIVQDGNRIRLETEGNLAATHDLSCIPLSQVKNVYTPPDLFGAFSKCVQEDKYESAVDVFVLAGAYGYFDKLRVTDISARQAIQALILNTMNNIDEKNRTEVKARLNAVSTPGSHELLRLCGDIKVLGHPEYFPGYMVKHGLKAFTGDASNPIAEGFDAKRGWITTLDKYLHCPPHIREERVKEQNN